MMYLKKIMRSLVLILFCVKALACSWCCGDSTKTQVPETIKKRLGEGTIYIPLSGPNPIEELMNLTVEKLVQDFVPTLANTQRDFNSLLNAFISISFKFAHEEKKWECGILDTVSQIKSAIPFRSMPQNSQGLLYNQEIAITVKNMDGALFFMQYKNGQFADINKSEGNPIAKSTAFSNEFCRTYRQNMADKINDPVVLNILFKFDGAINEDCRAQENDLQPIQEESIDLYGIQEGKVESCRDFFHDKPKAYCLLPYSDLAMLRTTTDGKKVLVRILGYKDGKPVMEYVKINGNEFEPGTKEESAACCEASSA